jgi:YidC/Oxa1 family membrane protein insertase
VPPLATFLQPLVDVNEAILKFFHNNLGFGWGAAIVGLTVVIRLAILPLTFKQIRSMQALQRLAPEMKRIQERYKDDKKRQQQEIMAFYQEHQVNPLASCFPLLLQLPFFISLYQLQRTAHFKHEVNHAGFLFIPDLTKSVTGATLVALIVIYVATQLGSSLVTMVNVQDANQRRIMFALPFIFVFVIIRFPAGLIVYWITTNIWTIGQQLAVKRFLPPPEPLPAGAAAAVSGKSARAQARGRDGGAPGKPERARAEAGAGKSRSGDGGNGGPRKAPPPSPRKKKKRSGRRR